MSTGQEVGFRVLALYSIVGNTTECKLAYLTRRRDLATPFNIILPFIQNMFGEEGPYRHFLNYSVLMYVLAIQFDYIEALHYDSSSDRLISDEKFNELKTSFMDAWEEKLRSFSRFVKKLGPEPSDEWLSQAIDSDKVEALYNHIKVLHLRLIELDGCSELPIYNTQGFSLDLVENHLDGEWDMDLSDDFLGTLDKAAEALAGQFPLVYQYFMARATQHSVTLPLQVVVEYLDFLSHISSAIVFAALGSQDQCKMNISSAERHLKRACLDLHKNMHAMLLSLHHYNLSPDYVKDILRMRHVYCHDNFNPNKLSAYENMTIGLMARTGISN